MFLFYCICSWFCFCCLTEATHCIFLIQFCLPHCLCHLWVHSPHSSAFSYCLMILCSHLRLGHQKSDCKPCVVGLFAVGFTVIDLIEGPDSCWGSPNVSIYKSSLLGNEDFNAEESSHFLSWWWSLGWGEAVYSPGCQHIGIEFGKVTGKILPLSM